MLWTPTRYVWSTNPAHELELEHPKLQIHSSKRVALRKASRNPLEYGGGTPGEFTIDDLKEIAGAAEKLRIQILRLRGTRLVKDLSAAGEIEDDDLLSSHVVFGHQFRGLTLLPEIAKAVLKNLDYRSDLILRQICLYVRKKTAAWNDALVSGWLRDTQKPHVESASSLKQWRWECGLTG